MTQTSKRIWLFGALLTVLLALPSSVFVVHQTEVGIVTRFGKPAAEAEANRRLQAAQGATLRFADLLAQKRRSPDLTHTDLYTRAVRTVLPKTRLIVLAPGDVPSIDINLLDRNRP